MNVHLGSAQSPELCPSGVEESGCRPVMAVPHGIFGQSPSTPPAPRFCETNPFVMLGKVGLSGCCEVGWKHYRKMTNGFVFSNVALPTAGRPRRSVALQGRT